MNVRKTSSWSYAPPLLGNRVRDGSQPDILPCPLYLRKRTRRRKSGASALGHKRTSVAFLISEHIQKDRHLRSLSDAFTCPILRARPACRSSDSISYWARTVRCTDFGGRPSLLDWSPWAKPMLES